MAQYETQKKSEEQKKQKSSAGTVEQTKDRVKSSKAGVRPPVEEASKVGASFMGESKTAMQRSKRSGSEPAAIKPTAKSPIPHKKVHPMTSNTPVLNPQTDEAKIEQREKMQEKLYIPAVEDNEKANQKVINSELPSKSSSVVFTTEKTAKLKTKRGSLPDDLGPKRASLKSTSGRKRKSQDDRKK